MKRITRISLVCIIGSISSLGLSQSDTPCDGAGAPLISVDMTCNLTTVNIVGANEQTDAANGGTPGCGVIGEDVWFSFVAPAIGGVNLFTSAGSITDAVMALYSGPCGSLSEIACSDDDNGLMPEINLGGLIPGDTYFIRLWEFAGSNGTFDLCVTEANVTMPTNTDCSIPDPICSGSPIMFTAQANGTQAATIDPGNNYDCLITSPNPSWYFLEIDQGGNLSIDITAPEDVDFAIWGPYTDLADAIANCNSYPVPLDCSFSPSEIERADVANVSPGEVYILLITNFANTVQMISLSDSPVNTALTDCSIVPVILPVELADFYGMRTTGGVQLNWLTASEVSNDYFAIERSTDAETWQAFDIVKGQGTTTSATSYQIVDRNAPEELIYYRLKQYDFDGEVSYSDVISIAEGSDAGLSVFPNPASTSFTVNAGSIIDEIVVTDIQGTVVFSETGSKQQSKLINTTSFKNGIYYVRVISKNEVFTKKVSVAK